MARRHKVFRHLFSGHCNPLVLERGGNGYLRTACDYVHLNPARTKSLEASQDFREYRRSGRLEYLKGPGKRWVRLRV